MTNTLPRSLEKQQSQELTPTHAESQHIELLGTIGIETQVASKTLRLYELNVAGGVLLKVYNKMSELRADERNCQDTADKTKRAVLMGLPLDALVDQPSSQALAQSLYSPLRAVPCLLTGLCLVTQR